VTFSTTYSILMRRAGGERLHSLPPDVVTNVVTGARTQFPLDRDRGEHRCPIVIYHTKK